MKLRLNKRGKFSQYNTNATIETHTEESQKDSNLPAVQQKKNIYIYINWIKSLITHKTKRFHVVNTKHSQKDTISNKVKSIRRRKL